MAIRSGIFTCFGKPAYLEGVYDVLYRPSMRIFCYDSEDGWVSSDSIIVDPSGIQIYQDVTFQGYELRDSIQLKKFKDYENLLDRNDIDFSMNLIKLLKEKVPALKISILKKNDFSTKKDFLSKTKKLGIIKTI